MSFMIYCGNTGCGKQSTPALDLKTNKVFCSECNGEMNLPEPTKLSLKSMGQIVRKEQTRQAFSVKCTSCGVDSRPKVVENNKVVCSSCDEELNLSAPFKQTILLNFRAQQR